MTRSSLFCRTAHLAAVALVAAAARAQVPPESATRHPEAMVRATPEMARALARVFTKEVLAPRYELDPAAADEAAKLLARRLMAAAHSADKQGMDFAEYVMGEMIRNEVEHGNERRGPPPEFLQHGSEKMVPFIPVLRELVGGFGSDLRQMLPPRQQLKLLGDLALAGTALNAFDDNVHRWASGEPFLNGPFKPHQEIQPVPLDSDGQSTALKRARKSGQQALDAEQWIKAWHDYVEQAKKFYALDVSQSATAESLLREYIERLKIMIQDPGWRDGLARAKIWQEMSWNMTMGGGLLRQLAAARLGEYYKTPADLGQEFKRRIDEIPTAVQRQTAEERTARMLANKGFSNEVPAP